MYVIIGVYPAMSNSQKQLANCLIRRETSVVLIVFNDFQSNRPQVKSAPVKSASIQIGLKSNRP